MPKRKYLDLVIDLETLGVKRTSPIISVGALWIEKDTNNDHTLHSLYKIISIKECTAEDIDATCLSWWVKNVKSSKFATDFEKSCGVTDVACMNKYLNNAGTGSSFNSALALYQFIKEAREYADTNGLKFNIWGCSPSFDLNMVDYWFKKTCMDITPWQYYEERDVRTIRDLVPHKAYKKFKDEYCLGDMDLKEIVDYKHNAFSDCVNEMIYIEMYRAIQEQMKDKLTVTASL